MKSGYSWFTSLTHCAAREFVRLAECRQCCLELFARVSLDATEVQLGARNRLTILIENAAADRNILDQPRSRARNCSRPRCSRPLTQPLLQPSRRAASCSDFSSRPHSTRGARYTSGKRWSSSCKIPCNSPDSCPAAVPWTAWQPSFHGPSDEPRWLGPSSPVDAPLHRASCSQPPAGGSSRPSAREPEKQLETHPQRHAGYVGHFGTRAAPSAHAFARGLRRRPHPQGW